MFGFYLKNKRKIGKKGFTLIELLVVISIISMLSSVVIASLLAAKRKAFASAASKSVYELQKAIELYANDHNGEYPGEIRRTYQYGSGNTDLVDDLIAPGGPLAPYLQDIPDFYLDKFEKDPIGSDRVMYIHSIDSDTFAADFSSGCGSYCGAGIIQSVFKVYCGKRIINKYAIIYSTNSFFNRLQLPTFYSIEGNASSPINENTSIFCVGE